MVNQVSELLQKPRRRRRHMVHDKITIDIMSSPSSSSSYTLQLRSGPTYQPPVPTLNRHFRIEVPCRPVSKLLTEVTVSR